MKYQSFSRVTKTYHGVTFHPGDIKDVNGNINDSHFVRIKEDKKKTNKEKSTDVVDERPVRKQQPQKNVKSNNNAQHKEDKKIESEPVVDKAVEESQASTEKKENVSD